MIGGVVLDERDVRVARLSEVGLGRGQPDVGVARALDIVRAPAGRRSRSGSLPPDCMPMITELEPVTGLGGSDRSSSRMSCSAEESVVGRSPRATCREIHRLAGQVGLGDAELELGEVEILDFSPPAGGHFQVGEAQLGVAAQPAPAGQLVDVNHPEPPGAAVKEGADSRGAEPCS